MQFWSVDSLFFEFRLEEFDLEVFLKKVLSNSVPSGIIS
jgi:hypothetical protein